MRHAERSYPADMCAQGAAIDAFRGNPAKGPRVLHCVTAFVST